jgi:ParB family chromosome partitioning protein
MNARTRTGLGRGLGDLITRTDPDLAPAEAPGMPSGARFEEVPVASIRPNPRQPRQVFDEEALAELVDSIGEVGLLQPIVVRPVEAGQYELVMGERRLRASQQAGLATIPAIIRPTEEADLLRDALLENLHRAQLNPLEEAAAYQQLLEDFGCTQEELSRRIKRSRPQISNTIRLLQLPPTVQRRVAAGVISAGHARALLALATPEAIEHLANRVVAENLSVRAVEELVAVGETGTKRARAPRLAAERPPLATEVEERLTDALDTRVTVATAGGRGRITIEFADLDDLKRLSNLLVNS